MSGNWVDLLIILVLVYFATEAWRHGLWVILADFVSFLGSLVIALQTYTFMAGILKENFSLSNPVANALGFLTTAIVSEALLGYLFAFALTKVPEKIRKVKYSKALAVLPALGQGLVLISFILILLLNLPIKGEVKNDIAESKIGGYLVTQTSGVEKRINEVFGGVIENSLTYLTVRPNSKESIPLTVEAGELRIDEQAESEMFQLVNKERREEGLPELAWDPRIVPVSRQHARDMWDRKYFGHVSPEGEDVGDRLAEHKVNYTIAGENLALAPTLSTAHTGLMSSEGHRANILELKFKKVGIGVIDNGHYGKMFVQVFTD